jgi:hypothetical protein
VTPWHQRQARLLIDASKAVQRILFHSRKA